MCQVRGWGLSCMLMLRFCEYLGFRVGGEFAYLCWCFGLELELRLETVLRLDWSSALKSKFVVRLVKDCPDFFVLLLPVLQSLSFLGLVARYFV